MTLDRGRPTYGLEVSVWLLRLAIFVPGQVMCLEMYEQADIGQAGGLEDAQACGVHFISPTRFLPLFHHAEKQPKRDRHHHTHSITIIYLYSYLAFQDQNQLKQDRNLILYVLFVLSFHLRSSLCISPVFAFLSNLMFLIQIQFESVIFPFICSFDIESINRGRGRLCNVTHAVSAWGLEKERVCASVGKCGRTQIGTFAQLCHRPAHQSAKVCRLG